MSDNNSKSDREIIDSIEKLFLESKTLNSNQKYDDTHLNRHDSSLLPIIKSIPIKTDMNSKIDFEKFEKVFVLTGLKEKPEIPERKIVPKEFQFENNVPESLVNDEKNPLLEIKKAVEEAKHLFDKEAPKNKSVIKFEKLNKSSVEQINNLIDIRFNKLLSNSKTTNFNNLVKKGIVDKDES